MGRGLLLTFQQSYRHGTLSNSVCSFVIRPNKQFFPQYSIISKTLFDEIQIIRSLENFVKAGILNKQNKILIKHDNNIHVYNFLLCFNQFRFFCIIFILFLQEGVVSLQAMDKEKVEVKRRTLVRHLAVKHVFRWFGGQNPLHKESHTPEKTVMDVMQK